MTADPEYRRLLQSIVTSGQSVRTRNADVRRVVAHMVRFDRTPLVGLRVTAWRNCLREMEFFLRGGVHLGDLHSSVRPWWEPFCTSTPDSLLHSYGTALRRLYYPDESTVVGIRPLAGSVGLPHRAPRQLGGESSPGEVGPLTGRRMQSTAAGPFEVLRVVGRRGSNRVYQIRFDDTGNLAEYRGDVIRDGRVKDRYKPGLYGVGWLGCPSRRHPMIARARQNWDHMMQRCYDPVTDGYRQYGARGVSVCGRWHGFENYLDDLSVLPGYAEWLLSPTEYHLDKDYYGSKVYGPDICVFLPVAWNTSLSKSQGKFSVYKGDSLVREFLTVADMNRFFGLRKSNPRGVERLGFRVAFVPNDDGVIYRYKLMVDQVQDLIDGVRNHASSRRNVISTWIPHHVQAGLVNPTNCHGTVIQAFVEPDNALHLVTYQRSADVVCGVPHNWLQYWAFLMWLAHRTGRGVGSLSWVGGDCHAYREHDALVAEILAAADDHDPPQLVYRPTGETFRAEDFTLDRPYNPKVRTRARMVV